MRVCVFAGRLQTTTTAVVAPQEARDDWKILRALSEVMGETLPYDSLQGVRDRAAELAPNLLTEDELVAPSLSDPLVLGHGLGGTASGVVSGAGASGDALKSTVDNFYMTDVISRSSAVMAKCTAAYSKA